MGGLVFQYLIQTLPNIHLRSRTSVRVGGQVQVRLLASPPVALASQHSLACDVLLYSPSADIRYM